MATGHLSGERKPKNELYTVLGEADTAALYARPVKLDTSRSIPYGGGISVDGKTVYIDEQLYREVMSGKVAVRGMTGRQIIARWLEHEHTEKSVEDGDNPSDTYQSSHGFATTKEEEGVPNPDRYEDAIRPALDRCIRRDPVNPPQDLWCGPYLDEPSKRDLEILRIFRAKGVLDAFKLSKIEVRYGLGGERCERCKHFGEPTKVLSECELVCGLVRDSRHCDRWEKRR